MANERWALGVGVCVRALEVAHAALDRSRALNSSIRAGVDVMSAPAALTSATTCTSLLAALRAALPRLASFATAHTKLAR